MLLSDMSQGLDYLMQQTEEEHKAMINRFKEAYYSEEQSVGVEDCVSNNKFDTPTKKRRFEAEKMAHSVEQ